MKNEIACDYILHHLRLFGQKTADARNEIRFLITPEAEAAQEAQACAEAGNIVAAVLPAPSFLEFFGIAAGIPIPSEEDLIFPDGNTAIHTLHPACKYPYFSAEVFVSTIDNTPVWFWVKIGHGGLLVIGTDLANDLQKFRQGNPERAKNRPTDAMWGITGERPNYLFDDNFKQHDAAQRPADVWVKTLAAIIADKQGTPWADILPGGASGAIVLTGDDDQAYLEKYDEQLQLLDGLPITYLLHPLTRHTKKTLRAMLRKNPNVDLGIHPDALDMPDQYGKIFDQQVSWYKQLVGTSPVSLRNHGFLNDGYWGHLPAWLKHDVSISSNLPGFDGCVMNGSLLPARMIWNDTLTSHWSILTAIGDGVRFAAGMTDDEAAECVHRVANRIKLSGIPGIMVLNLHPQNVAETRKMHIAVKELVASGFIAWNLRQCRDWFASQEQGALAGPSQAPRKLNWLHRIWKR